MRWLRHRKAQGDRAAGLSFAWRIGRRRFGSDLAALAVVGLSSLVLSSVVKVRVLSPVVRSERRASLLMLPEADADAWFRRRGAELSPFPAPLDLAGLDLAGQMLRRHPALTASGNAAYQPALRPLPNGETATPKAPVARGGRCELPPLPPVAGLPAADAVPVAGGGSRRPVLAPDAVELAVRVPVPLPRFVAPPDLVLPEGDLRFLIELDAGGRVIAAVPLDGGSSPAGAAAAHWLRGIRFEPVAGGAGWFAVAVAFVSSGDD